MEEKKKKIAWKKPLGIFLMWWPVAALTLIAIGTMIHVFGWVVVLAAFVIFIVPAGSIALGAYLTN